MENIHSACNHSQLSDVTATRRPKPSPKPVGSRPVSELDHKYKLLCDGIRLIIEDANQIIESHKREKNKLSVLFGKNQKQIKEKRNQIYSSIQEPHKQ
jgi:hypothetical protein